MGPLKNPPTASREQSIATKQHPIALVCNMIQRVAGYLYDTQRMPENLQGVAFTDPMGHGGDFRIFWCPNLTLCRICKLGDTTNMVKMVVGDQNPFQRQGAVRQSLEDWSGIPRINDYCVGSVVQ